MSIRLSVILIPVLIAFGLPSALAGEPPRSLDVPAYVDELVANGEASVGELTAALQGPHAGRAIEALGRIGSAGAAKPLLALAEAPDGETRAAVAWALGRCKDPAALPALVKLAGDRHAPARAAASWALGRLADPRAADALRQAVQDSDRNVRLAAVRGIAEGRLAVFFAVLTPRLDYETKMVPVEDETGKPKDPPELVEKVFRVEPD
ncbi:MAG TPA: HEAT repeat domain-containing protein, partial [Planctomycetota bacterium]|nr:HEAT repeat domain-containing protein [Planctomycetota bacterium]